MGTRHHAMTPSPVGFFLPSVVLPMTLHTCNTHAFEALRSACRGRGRVDLSSSGPLHLSCCEHVRTGEYDLGRLSGWKGTTALQEIWCVVSDGDGASVPMCHVST